MLSFFLVYFLPGSFIIFRLLDSEKSLYFMSSQVFKEITSKLASCGYNLVVEFSSGRSSLISEPLCISIMLCVCVCIIYLYEHILSRFLYFI